MSKVELRYNNKNLLKLIEECNKLNSISQVVGILDGAPSGLAEIGYKNEFGASAASSDLHKDIPERSFIRAPLEENWEHILDVHVGGNNVFEKDFWRRLIKRGASIVLDDIGQEAALTIQWAIIDDDPRKKANSPYTLARKNSTVPLHDKGVLENNITHKEVS